MRRSTAIVAIVVVAVVIIAAAGAILLLAPDLLGGGDQQNGTVPDTRPTGPEGSINGAVVNVGSDNATASPYPELLEEFNDTANATQEPDALAVVAITNNMTQQVVLNLSNFTAVLQNGSSVTALNNNQVTVYSNMTVYIILGFSANITNITNIQYSGDVEFELPMADVSMPEMPEPPMMQDVPQNISEDENLTLSVLRAWTIGPGENAPLPLAFMENRSVVLVLATMNNTNESAISPSAQDFWLELDNGTVVQADQAFNHNLPASIRPDRSVPFLLGFRVNETVEPQALYYWPDQGDTGAVANITNVTEDAAQNRVMLQRVWDEGENQSYRILINLVPREGEDANISQVQAWSLMEGLVEGEEVQNETIQDGQVYAFSLEEGDDIVLVQYQSDGETRYLWVRPVVPSG